MVGLPMSGNSMCVPVDPNTAAQILQQQQIQCDPSKVPGGINPQPQVQPQIQPQTYPMIPGQTMCDPTQTQQGNPWAPLGPNTMNPCDPTQSQTGTGVPQQQTSGNGTPQETILPPTPNQNGKQCFATSSIECHDAPGIPGSTQTPTGPQVPTGTQVPPTPAPAVAPQPTPQPATYPMPQPLAPQQQTPCAVNCDSSMHGSGKQNGQAVPGTNPLSPLGPGGINNCSENFVECYAKGTQPKQLTKKIGPFEFPVSQYVNPVQECADKCDPKSGSLTR